MGEGEGEGETNAAELCNLRKNLFAPYCSNYPHLFLLLNAEAILRAD